MIVGESPGRLTPEKNKDPNDKSLEIKNKGKAGSTPEKQQPKEIHQDEQQLPPTKLDMADMIDMICRLERTIKGEMGLQGKIYIMFYRELKV